ncbi:MAG: non-ribosomal peptide synthetase, partial [Streptomycetaceae bacterium]|nr:non-ribosomal peptide synthetase [Streptomycetaceae bacterium]
MPRFTVPVDDPEAVALVAACVAEVLGLDGRDDGGIAVDPDVRLTELGLESFTAVRLRRRIRERIGADLPIAEFLGDASVRAVARRLTGPSSAAEAFPLTPVQTAYWIGRDPSFPLGGVATFYFHEFARTAPGGDHERDLARLEDAWNALVRHHPMLRVIVDDDGMQRVLRDPGPYRIGRTDLREVPDAEREMALAGLRAARSHQLRPTDTWPLYDIHAALLPGGALRLFVGMDVLALDMASWLLIMRQWGELVADSAKPLTPCPTDFGTLVLGREADQEERRRREAARDYWARRAPELPPGPALPWTAAPAEFSRARFVRHEDG